MKYITKGISIIFHPIFIPMMAFFLYLQIEHYTVATMHSLTDQGFWIVFSAIGLFSFLLPLIAMNGMITTGIVQDWEIKNHKERVPVLMFSALFLACLYYIFHYIETNNGDVFHAFFGVIMSGVVLAVLAAGISYFWKISMHAIGISGLAGSLVGLTTHLDPLLNPQDMVFYNSILLSIVGIVGFARLYEKAHNLLQVLAGTALGFGVSFMIVIKEWYF
jgi:membrane-associated phospholipid phosphatase